MRFAATALIRHLRLRLPTAAVGAAGAAACTPGSTRATTSTSWALNCAVWPITAHSALVVRVAAVVMVAGTPTVALTGASCVMLMVMRSPILLLPAITAIDISVSLSFTVITVSTVITIAIVTAIKPVCSGGCSKTMRSHQWQLDVAAIAAMSARAVVWSINTTGSVMWVRSVLLLPLVVVLQGCIVLLSCPLVQVVWRVIMASAGAGAHEQSSAGTCRASPFRPPLACATAASCTTTSSSAAAAAALPLL